MINQEIAAQKQALRKSPFQRHENLTVLSIFVGFVIIVVLLQLIMLGGSRFPTFISPVNLLNILQQVGVPGIIAVGMTIVMISGGIDLSVGMLASLVSIVTALGISKWHLGVVPSILIGVMTAVALETLMGYIISRTKVEPFIITLGGMIAFQGIALLLCNSREVIMNGELDFLKGNDKTLPDRQIDYKKARLRKQPSFFVCEGSRAFSFPNFVEELARHSGNLSSSRP